MVTLRFSLQKRSLQQNFQFFYNNYKFSQFSQQQNCSRFLNHFIKVKAAHYFFTCRLNHDDFWKKLNHVKQFINKESTSDWVFCVLNIYHCQSLNRTNLLLKCKTMNDWSFFDTFIRLYRQMFINLWSFACKTYI